MSTSQKWLVIGASVGICMSAVFGVKLIADNFGIYAGLGTAVAVLIGAIAVRLGSYREHP